MGLIGSPGYTYDENIEPWGKAAPGWIHRTITDIAIDRQDNVYVYIRGEPWVMVFDSNGNLIRTWGDGYFKTPHGITTGIDGSVFCIDTVDQTIRKFTPDGELLMTLGESGRASGFLRGKPFHHPTDVAIDPRNGDILVSDGYSNNVVHRFTADGKLLDSWGESGTYPGQFNTLHSIACDRDGNIYVNDRENHRVQVFDPEGTFQTQWVNLAVNYAIHIDQTGDRLVYIGEDYSGLRTMDRGIGNYFGLGLGPRVTIFDVKGNVRSRIGEHLPWQAPKQIHFIHGMAVDSKRNIYMPGPPDSKGNEVEDADIVTEFVLQRFVSKD